VLGAFLAASLVTPALAQQGGGPGGGGFQMPPEMAKWRDQHKHHNQLSRMISRGLPELEKDKSTAITAAQAKSLLTILNPWKTKDKMTADQAKGLIKQVQNVFTAKQKTILGKIPEGRGFGGGRPGGGGPGGPGGGGPRAGGGGGFGGGGGAGNRQGGGGGGRGFNLAQMQNFNPFSTKAVSGDNRGASRRVETAKYVFSALSARSANKPLPKPPTQGRPNAGQTARR
jgi:hypothetical protein